MWCGHGCTPGTHGIYSRSGQSAAPSPAPSILIDAGAAEDRQPFHRLLVSDLCEQGAGTCRRNAEKETRSESERLGEGSSCYREPAFDSPERGCSMYAVALSAAFSSTKAIRSVVEGEATALHLDRIRRLAGDKQQQTPEGQGLNARQAAESILGPQRPIQENGPSLCCPCFAPCTPNKHRPSSKALVPTTTACSVLPVLVVTFAWPGSSGLSASPAIRLQCQVPRMACRKRRSLLHGSKACELFLPLIFAANIQEKHQPVILGAAPGTLCASPVLSDANQWVVFCSREDKFPFALPANKHRHQ